MAKTGIKIVNFSDVLRHMKSLDLMDRKNVSKARKVLKKPFLKMRRDARQNLKSQGSMSKNRLLYRGLSVGSKAYKKVGYFSVAFGGRGIKEKTPEGKSYVKNVNHFHLVNSGTKQRRTKGGRKTGAVGKSRTDYKGKNKSFQLGFADRAIKPVLPQIKGMYAKEFGHILNTVKTKGV